MSYKVWVQYKYGNVLVAGSVISVQGQTESAITSELQRIHPGQPIIILKIEWR